MLGKAAKSAPHPEQLKLSQPIFSRIKPAG